MEISKQQWIDWRQLDVTREYLERLFVKREELKEGLAEGQAADEGERDKIIGQCQAYKDAIDYGILSFEVTPTEEEDEGEHNGNRL